MCCTLIIYLVGAIVAPGTWVLCLVDFLCKMMFVLSVPVSHPSSHNLSCIVCSKASKHSIGPTNSARVGTKTLNATLEYSVLVDGGGVGDNCLPLDNFK